MGMVTSLFVRKMVAAAGNQVDGSDLLASVGIDASQPADPRLMVADTSYYDLLERMATLMDVTDLPIKTGASMRLDDYGALGLAFKAATDLRSSYGRVERYARLWTSVVEYTLKCEGNNTWFLLHRSGARRLGLRLSNEATLASAAAIAREVSPTGTFAPVEVHAKHPPPATLKHHETYFRSPVFFGSDRDGLLISNTSLKVPNKLGDKGICSFLTNHLDQELSSIPPALSTKDRLRDAIAQSLSEGLPKMEAMANRLGMSVRSLHRRLAEDGLNFQTLAEDTRRDLAEGLLKDEKHSLAEIAFLTGFSEQSSFTRAFKRWCGETPASYRKRTVA
ncbi:MAG: helix-turn-helix domain-containing protein [Silicimonas sp.]|nr:helix-turn-helix domain-containing protein [Silicimonas sp.]